MHNNACWRKRAIAKSPRPRLGEHVSEWIFIEDWRRVPRVCFRKREREREWERIKNLLTRGRKTALIATDIICQQSRLTLPAECGGGDDLYLWSRCFYAFVLRNGGGQTMNRNFTKGRTLFLAFLFNSFFSSSSHLFFLFFSSLFTPFVLYRGHFTLICYLTVIQIINRSNVILTDEWRHYFLADRSFYCLIHIAALLTRGLLQTFRRV